MSVADRGAIRATAGDRDEELRPEDDDDGGGDGQAAAGGGGRRSAVVVVAPPLLLLLLLRRSGVRPGGGNQRDARLVRRSLSQTVSGGWREEGDVVRFHQQLHPAELRRQPLRRTHLSHTLRR